MTSFTVALLQMASVGHDVEANRAKGSEFCRQAAALGADLALFPEMWSNGYEVFDPDEPGAREQWASLAVPEDGTYVNSFRALARELQMAIAVTYLQEWPDRPRNSVSLIDRHGEICFTYAKVHTCEFELEAYLTPGEAFHVATLDTAGGPVAVGAMICYDREFPETARILMLEGAEIILTPNACELELHRLSQYRTRAYENMIGVAMANYAVPQQNGHSVAYSPIGFTEKGSSMDNLVVEAGGAEGVYLARFDMAAIREWRQKEVWGNAFRRPRLYGALTAPEVREPFIRPEATR